MWGKLGPGYVGGPSGLHQEGQGRVPRTVGLSRSCMLDGVGLAACGAMGLVGRVVGWVGGWEGVGKLGTEELEGPGGRWTSAGPGRSPVNAKLGREPGTTDWLGKLRANCPHILSSNLLTHNSWPLQSPLAAGLLNLG